MVQDPASHRGSFSVPIHINLLNARRNYSRHNINPAAEASGQGRLLERRAQAPSSSVGEDRAVILGFTMMGFSVLMYFLFGFTVVKPYLHSRWSELSTCTLIRASVVEDALDCKEQGSFPCLEVLVNHSFPSWDVTLRYNEQASDPLHKCFFVPKCQRNKMEVLEEAHRIELSLQQQGRPFACLSRPEERPTEAILQRKYDGWLAARCLCWPTLVLVGGASIVGLVKLTQKLAHVCLSLQASESSPRDPWESDS